MLYSIGTKVRLKKTGDIAVVTELLENDMVVVYIENDDMKIPVFADDVSRIEEEEKGSKPRFQAGKKAKTLSSPERPVYQHQYTLLKSQGIQLAFEEILKSDSGTEKYIVYLINSTRYDVIFELEFELLGKKKWDANGKLKAISTFRLGEMPYDQLNDHPVFDIRCWRTSTEGRGDERSKVLKIKPKQFFKKVTTAPLLNKKTHLYRIFEKIETQSEKTKEDLKTYTKRKAVPLKYKNTNLVEFDRHNVKELAEFTSEIDLHIEKLVEGKRKMSNAEILRIQLQHFEKFLSKAIQLGIPSVFVIHGVGEGRLRNEIAGRLMQNPEVKTFKNEFHPRYGYGATEIILNPG